MAKRRRRHFDPSEWDDDYEDLPSTPLKLTVYPDEDEPEPVLYLPDGTELYRMRAPFGFNQR